jgi:FRG domain
MIEERVCRDWLDLQQELYVGSWNQEIGRHRSRFAYRGLANSAYRLETTLQRMGGPFAQLETHLIRNFRKYAYEHTALTHAGLILNPGGHSMWNWLVLARHHGLPTRLLDWTYSPYVALHFATEDLLAEQASIDSVIWCVDYTKAHALLPGWLQSVLQAEESDVLTVDMLTHAVPDLGTFDERAADRGLTKGPNGFVVFFEPPSFDARVVNQFALHSMMSSSTASLEQWLEQHPELGRKLIIPAKLKWEVRDKLDQANINERLLYPGLDGLCRWLRRYYGPRTDLGM